MKSQLVQPAPCTATNTSALAVASMSCIGSPPKLMNLRGQAEGVAFNNTVLSASYSHRTSMHWACSSDCLACPLPSMLTAAQPIAIPAHRHWMRLIGEAGSSGQEADSRLQSSTSSCAFKMLRTGPCRLSISTCRGSGTQWDGSWAGSWGQYTTFWARHRGQAQGRGCICLSHAPYGRHQLNPSQHILPASPRTLSTSGPLSNSSGLAGSPWER